MTALTTDETSAATPTPHRRSPALDWVGIAARLILGGILVWFGALKLPNLQESVLATRAYKLLPYDVATVVGYVLPLAEVALGLLLILGLFTRFAGAAGALLMLAFTLAIASVWYRGIAIDCGCLGGGGEIAWEQARALYPWEIARDVGLFLCGAFLVWRPQTPLSLDSWLFRTSTLDDLDLDDSTDEKETTA